MCARRFVQPADVDTGAEHLPRRPRTAVAALAVAGLAACTALSGCGSDSDSGKNTQSKNTQSKETPSAGEDQAKVVSTAYEKTAESDTAKMKVLTETSAGAKSVSVRGTGVIDFEDGASKLTLSGEGQRIEQRVIGGVLFQQPPKKERQQIPGNKSWVKVDLVKVAEHKDRAGGDRLNDPAESAAYSRAISGKGVEKLGNQKLDGTQTTRYRVTVDVDKLAEANQAKATQLKREFGRYLPMELWLDDDGRIRRQQVELTPHRGENGAQQVTARTVIDYTDYGTDAEIEAPPRDQTADLTKKAMG
ncbi:hypothetical protein [Streptomyces zagrosensis]|uniref:Lipoprotein n=1 Tax=Streptomyces zagrosensis TaxID=1042984 RepID=A0A7W9QBZ7_9ACTN|nr:hypothetical protein [Streptomyces zagrosensis]MBB5937451.1 hypothetical protein [Streptomyces zagrosensis]